MKTSSLINDELQRLKAERKQLSEECRCLQQHLLAYATIWDSVLERESKAIAGELHDDLGQVLTALRLDISLLMLQHKTDSVLIGKANGMMMLTDRCMRAVSVLINLLRPVNLDQGLVPALEELCRNLKQQHNLCCTCTISCNCDSLDEAHTRVLFRILHEALINVAKHAGPCSASVRLNPSANGGIKVEISDDGCGFDSSEIADRKYVGLILMRESAFALGGQIEITSEKGIGTKVVLLIPRNLDSLC